MNSVVNFNTSTPQVNFGCKKVNQKKVYQVIDSVKDNDVNISKKRERIGKSLKEVLRGFGEKLRNAGREKSEAEKQDKILNNIDKINKNIQLKLLMRRNPDEARELIMRESMEDIGRFIKDI